MFENWYKCLPMYDSIDRQHRTENEVINQQVNWLTYNNYLLPFQVKRLKHPSTSWVFRMYEAGGAYYRDMMTELIPTQIIVNSVVGSDIIQFIATQAVQAIDCGAYYYYFSDGVNEWWSELFVVKDEAKDVGAGMAIVDDDNMMIIIATPSLPLVSKPIGSPIVAERS